MGRPGLERVFCPDSLEKKTLIADSIALSRQVVAVLHLRKQSLS